ncbi:MAG: hypothetical protein MZW92_31090 [Comamonadaceae bacterium]|nr:hypothetical protein [Comamonadaceae bacterium]
MIIKARLANLSMTEIPVTLFRDGRSRPPHLKRWSDGWRHLRFMLLHSPRWLFLYPGITMILVGLTGELILMQGMYTIGDVSFDVHTLLVMAFVLILGFQTICTGIFARLYCFLSGILPWDPKFDRFMKGLDP